MTYPNYKCNARFLVLILQKLAISKMLKNAKNSLKGQNAVVDTLAALVYDVNATAEVLRRGSQKRKPPKVHEVRE